MSVIDFKKIQSYISLEKVKNFDRFLDALPSNVGYNALIFAFSTWVLAGLAITFTMVETRTMAETRTKLLEVEALQPPVPQISYTPIPKKQLELLIKSIDKLYPGVSYIVDGNGKISISAGSVIYIPQFRAAISHLQNGGKLWRTELSSLCFGKECTGPKLQAELRLDRVRIEEARIQSK